MWVEFGHQGRPVPKRIVRASGLRESAIGFHFDCMDEIRKFDGILNEEHWDVVPDQVPVPLFCVEFYGEPSHVARGVYRSGAARHRRKASEQRRLFASPLKQVGLSDIGQRFVIFEITVGGRTARVHNAFRNSFVVKMEYFFSQYEIFN